MRCAQDVSNNTRRLQRCQQQQRLASAHLCRIPRRRFARVLRRRGRRRRGRISRGALQVRVEMCTRCEQQHASIATLPTATEISFRSPLSDFSSAIRSGSSSETQTEARTDLAWGSAKREGISCAHKRRELLRGRAEKNRKRNATHSSGILRRRRARARRRRSCRPGSRRFAWAARRSDGAGRRRRRRALRGR